MQVVVHTQPTVRGYQTIIPRGRDVTLRPAAIPLLHVQVADILDCR